jgi:hypothetical protein
MLTVRSRFNKVKLMDRPAVAGFTRVFSIETANRERTEVEDYLGHGWGFSWPSDAVSFTIAQARSRMVSRGANKLVWWESEKWTGIDVPDFKANISVIDRGTNRS